MRAFHTSSIIMRRTAMRSSIFCISVTLLAQQYWCAGSPPSFLSNFIENDATMRPSRFCMVAFPHEQVVNSQTIKKSNIQTLLTAYSLDRVDKNLVNPKTLEIPKTRALSWTSGGKNIILTTLNCVAPPLINENPSTAPASYASAPLVISVSFLATRRMPIMIQGGTIVTISYPAILTRNALVLASFIGLDDVLGDEGGVALKAEEAIMCALGGPASNRLNMQNLKVPDTRARCADGNDSLGTKNQIVNQLEDVLQCCFRALPLVAIYTAFYLIIDTDATTWPSGFCMGALPHEHAISSQSIKSLCTQALLTAYSLDRVDENPMNPLPIPKSRALPWSSSGQNIILMTLNCVAPPLINVNPSSVKHLTKGLNEAPNNVLDCLVQVPAKHWYDQSLDHAVNRIENFFLSLALSAAALFIAISVIIHTIIATNRRYKITPFCRRIIMMQPSTLLTCSSLVAFFTGQVNAIFISEGVCLAAAMGGSPSCTANDVKITSVVKTSGPLVCPEGSSVIVTLNTTLFVNANTRYDIGAYVGINGANAKNAPGNSSCLVKSLYNSSNITTVPKGIIGSLEDNKNDDCLDSSAGTITGFVLENFTVFCNYTEFSTQVSASVCLVWDNNKNTNCTQKCPGATNQNICLTAGTDSKCWCQDIIIPNITVVTPTPSSNPSSNPSGRPSRNPSSNPSGRPSQNPSSNP
ncbi:hypothetical protein ACHAXA_008411, partial [Cyclostephanos tholiformis]